MRWKRRHPALWGLCAVVMVIAALFITTKFFLDLSLPAASPSASDHASPAGEAVEEYSLPAVEFQLAPSWQDRKALPGALALSQPPEVLWREINETFAAGDFPAAEKAYRQFQTIHRASPMLFFRLLLCLVAQDKAGEAREVAGKLPVPEASVGPAAFYGRAVILWMDGEPAEGAKLIREANTRFPLVAADYIRVMSQFVAHFPAISDLVDSALPGLAEKASED